MKLVLIFGFLIAGSTLKAEGLTCSTSGLPTTSYTLFETENKQGHVLQVAHHNGAKFAPIHDGIITSYDFEFLQRKSKIVLALGDYYEFPFQKGECEQMNGRQVCHSNRGLKVGDADLKSYGVSIFKEVVSNPYGEFVSWKVRSYVQEKKNPLVHSFLMEYFIEDCNKI